MRSENEIRETLDARGAVRDCVFTPEMYKYCEQKLKVFKRVEYFYDEVKQKMCKCKNVYLLDGALCTGERKVFSEPCDRNCFLFWHTAWLETVE